MLAQNRTRSRPGQTAGPALNGTNAGLPSARPSSQMSGSNRSAQGRSGSRWKSGAKITTVVPAGPQAVSSVVSRRIIGVVGQSRTASCTQARR